MRTIMVLVVCLLVVLLGACSWESMTPEACAPPALNSDVLLTEGVFAGMRGTVTNIQWLASNPDDKAITLARQDGSSVIVSACIDWMPAAESVGAGS